MQDELLKLYFEDTLKEVEEAYGQFEKIEESGRELYEFIKKLKNMEVASSMLEIRSNSDYIKGVKDIFMGVNDREMEINAELRVKTVKALDTMKKYLEIQKGKFENQIDIESDNQEELEEKKRVLEELNSEMEKVLENSYDIELYNIDLKSGILKVLEVSGKVEILEKDGKIVLNYSSKLGKDEVLGIFSNINIPYFTLKGISFEGEYKSLDEFYINIKINRDNVVEAYKELKEIRGFVKGYNIIDSMNNSDIYAVQLLESFKS